MNRTAKLFSSVLLAVLLASAGISAVESKNWTVDERQLKLMQEINQGQKSKELTMKEAHKLRKKLADAARYKALAKSKNENKLSPDKEKELEQKLNDISTEIHKYELEKRVQAK